MIDANREIESRILDLDKKEFILFDEVKKRFGGKHNPPYWKLVMPNLDNYQLLTVYATKYFTKYDVMAVLKGMNNDN